MRVDLSLASLGDIRNVIDSADGNSGPVLFGRALDQVLQDGIQKDWQGAYAYRLAVVDSGEINRSPSADLGIVVERADFSTQKTRIGSLSADAIHSGVRLRVIATMQKHLACGGQREVNQRTLTHLVAAIE